MEVAPRQENAGDRQAQLERDIVKMIHCKAHIGNQNCHHMMRPYIFKRSAEGMHLFDVLKTWEKLVVAARVCATVQNPQDILVMSQKPTASRAIFKFAHYTKAQSQVSRWTAGTLTNQITKQYREPQVLIVADPTMDSQAIAEAHYSNVPVIALCNSNTALQNVDVAIPCNTKNPHSIGIIFYLLAREILYLRSALPRGEEWSVVPDLFFHKEDVEEKKDQATGSPKFEDPTADPAMAGVDNNWGEAAPDAAPQEAANW